MLKHSRSVISNRILSNESWQRVHCACRRGNYRLIMQRYRIKQIGNVFRSFRINEIYTFVILSICISAVGVCLIPVIKLPSVMNCQRRCDYSRVSPRQRLYLVYLNSTHIIHHISHAVRHENLYLHSSLC